MDTKTFSTLFPNSKPDAATWCGALATAFQAGEITTARRQAHFLGQTGVESSGFTALAENLNYSVQGLLDTFNRKSVRISTADAQRLGRKAGEGPLSAARQEAIANLVYGGEFGRRELGNTAAGDGWRFRGGGILQLTGRDNFTRVAAILGITPEALADQVRSPAGAAMASALWWRGVGLNQLADADDHAGVTRRINAASLGAKERKDITLRAASLLSAGGRPAVPVKASGSAAVKPVATADDLNAAFLASLRG